MKLLTPKPLTAEAFRPYGNVIETDSTKSISINSGNCLRYSNLAEINIDGSDTTGISLFDAKTYTSPFQLKHVERHPLGSQAFLPMTLDKYLVIVADDVNNIAQQPKVFLTNGRQGVNYRRNIWHGVLTPIVTNALFAVVDYVGLQGNMEEYVFDTPYLIEF